MARRNPRQPHDAPASPHARPCLARPRPPLPRRDRVARQAARLRVPQQRDLRRLLLDLGLRTHGRGAQAQRQGAVVARHGARAPRHRRARRRDPDVAQGVGGQRPPRELHRPARRLPGVQAALPRGSTPRRRPLPQLWRCWLDDRGAPVQPHVPDPRGPRGGRRLSRLPAARDGAGHLRQLRQRAHGHAPPPALRHRADRQVLPQRDHAGQLHLPHPRVRADGDGVLRPARRRPRVARALDRPARAVVPGPGHRPGQPPARRPPAREALPLLRRHHRPAVPLPLGLGRTGGHRQPHRLRPQDARASTAASA